MGSFPYFSEAIEAMAAGEAAAAVAMLKPLFSVSPGERRVPAALRRESKRALLMLLERRGFFPAPPAKLEASLEEIRSLGAGFDLFDLCCLLARIDRESTGSGRRRAIPELAPFTNGVHSR